MIVAGIDIGSATAKAVIMQDYKIIAWSKIATSTNSTETAQEVMQKTLDETNLSARDIQYIVSTGYGRANVNFGNKTISEISCHAKGSIWFFPNARTIVDIGGQDSKFIRCNENGDVQNFILNDKCAAGTGRYIERIARMLQIPLEQFGDLSFQTVEGPANITSTCAVFAENDIALLLRRGKAVNDILAGACESLLKRIDIQLRRLGIVEDITICGGIAKNGGVVKRLENQLALSLSIAFEPQIVGAIGACLFAHEILST
jgi:predicted CoA-substrate-specific enzyme activase